MRREESSSGRLSISCTSTAGGAVVFFRPLKTNGASTWMWTSPGFDGGSGSVSDPCDGKAAEDTFSAGVEGLPSVAFAESSDPGAGGGLARNVFAGGGGQPHSRGTSVSTLSIRPERKTACSDGLT